MIDSWFSRVASSAREWILNFALFPKLFASSSRSFMDNGEKKIGGEGAQLFRAYGKTTTLFVPHFVNEEEVSDRAIIYFHDNGEELKDIRENLGHMARELRCNVFAAEYPGYGVYKGSQWNVAKTHQVIKSQAQTLFLYLRKVLHFKLSNIVIIGRSIGTGPACHLAAHSQSPNLILISPFFNIKNMILQKTSRFLSNIFSEHFPNSQNIINSKARLMVIHGMQDDVISVQNSLKIKQIYENDEIKRECKFLFPQDMTHDHYDIRNDIIEPIKEFLGVQREGLEGKKGGFRYERIMAEIKKPGIGIEIEDKK